MKLFLPVLLIGSAFMTALYGQSESPYFQHLTLEDGLSNTINHFIYKDRGGFLWISSLNGLNRFDGRTVKVYEPDYDDPYSIYGQNIQSPFFETGNGDLWFATYIGINLYVRSHDHFEHVVIQTQDGQQPKGYYAFYVDEAENLWFLNQNKDIYRLHTATREVQPFAVLPHEVHRLRVWPHDRGRVAQLWGYSYHEPGLLFASFENDRPDYQYLFTRESERALEIKDIELESDTLAWLATSSGLYTYNIASRNLQRCDLWKGQTVGAFNSLSLVGPDTLLAASEGNGVFVFDTKKKTFKSLISSSSLDPNSLSSNLKNKLNTTRDGGLWINAQEEGVDYFYPQKQKFGKILLKEKNGTVSASQDITCFAEDIHGNTWCGNRLGIFVLDNNKEVTTRHLWKKNDPHSIPDDKIIQMIPDEKGRIWVLTWKGLAVWLPEQQRFQRINSDQSTLIHAQLLSNGTLLLSGLQGSLYELDTRKDEFELNVIPAMQEKGAFSTFFQTSSNYLLACHQVSSIWVLDISNGYKKIATLNIPGESNVYYEHPADSSVWISTTYGLVRVSNDLEQIHVYDEKHGLPSRISYGMLPGKNNELWIGTNQGLASFNLDSKTGRGYLPADGIPSLSFSRIGCLAHSSGELWFGTTKGVTVFSPEQVKPIPVKAKPAITSILVNDQPLEGLTCDLTGATNVSEIKKLHLSHLQRTLSFNFAALEYSDPENTRFKYMMKGLDKEWVESGTNNFTRYANIPNGSFTFLLKASNSDGEWSGPAKLALYIEPPFWLKWWFFAICILLTAGTVWLIMYTRQKRREKIRQLELEKRIALEQERQRIARDVHDDLGSGLSALSLVTELAKYRTTPEELKSDIEKINTSARDLSGKIREVIWTVSARNDTLSNLISYLNNYSIDLMEQADMDIQISLPDDEIPEISVSGEYRRTTFLAFKEALNNILKHAGASLVKIDFETSAAQLTITVSDNGGGFDPALLENATGNGLLNMRSRMQDIGGNCRFETGPEGTRVIFTVNFTTD